MAIPSKSRVFLSAFAWLFLLSFAPGLLIIFLLGPLLGYKPVISVFMFWKGYSFAGVSAAAVIGIVCFSYALLAALWVTFLGHIRGWLRWMGIAGVLLVSLIYSFILGGLVWVFFDMLAGYFPAYPRIVDHFIWGATTALELGPWTALRYADLVVAYFIIGSGLIHVMTKRLNPSSKEPTIQRP